MLNHFIKRKWRKDITESSFVRNFHIPFNCSDLQKKDNLNIRRGVEILNVSLEKDFNTIIGHLWEIRKN